MCGLNNLKGIKNIMITREKYILAKKNKEYASSSAQACIAEIKKLIQKLAEENTQLAWYEEIIKNSTYTIKEYEKRRAGK